MLGGVIPVVLAVILFKILPESPRYMASRRDRWPELIGMLRKLGHNVASDATFVDGAGAKPAKSKSSMADLFVPEFRRDTLGLFGSFFFCLMVNYIGILLLVATLTGTGFTQPDASNALFWWNNGGVVGALLGAVIIQRLGSRIAMLGLSAIAIASAFVVAGMQLNPANAFALLLMFIVLGGTLNAVQTTMYALAANVYPTEIRGTGIGTAVAVGRIGNVLASYVGNFAINIGGPAAYFSTFGIGMILVFVSLAVIRRHIDRSVADVAPMKVGAPAGH
jgi:AAHS family 4-hydroxybenzoate transporter-like MFS transporter